MNSNFWNIFRERDVMSYSIPDYIVEKNSVQVRYLAPSVPPVGRDAILKRIIDLEYEFKVYLLRAFKRIHPEISEAELGHKGLFSEGNMFENLTKCLTLAKALNLVDSIIDADLRKMVRLRNMYAHGRHRTELKEDAEAAALVRSTRIYANSKASLDTLDIGKAFFCCTDRLTEIIVERRNNLTL